MKRNDVVVVLYFLLLSAPSLNGFVDFLLVFNPVFLFLSLRVGVFHRLSLGSATVFFSFVIHGFFSSRVE